MAPYRAVSGEEILEAPARAGRARLAIAARTTELVAGDVTLTVGDTFATVVARQKRRTKKRSMRLEEGARLVVARGIPTEEIGIWYENPPGKAVRIFGITPPELLDQEALAAWRQTERMNRRLRVALRPHSRGVLRAFEVGHGVDRVLVTDLGDRYVGYVRKLFRERAERAIEVHDDGTVVIPRRRKNEARFRCTSRFGVTVLGDHIRFSAATGEDLGSVSIPWIAPEDRAEIARRFAEMVDPG